MGRKLLAAAVLALLVVACHVTPPGMETETAIPISPTTFDLAALEEIDLSAYPVMPVVSERAREIYRVGLAQGRNPRVFSRVGDCMTAAADFLTPFGAGDYNLSDYGDLQETVDYFSQITIREIEGQAVNSFSNPSLAAADGLTSAGALDSLWANPAWCRAGESPLACEYRVSNPSLALIMFGTNDSFFVEPDRFDLYMRTIVEETIEVNVVPILVTFPTRLDRPEESETFNRIVVRIATDYDVPLVNLWLALQELPNGGVNPEEVTHLTIPADGCAACLTEENLASGLTLHNAIAVMALDEVRRALAED